MVEFSELTVVQLKRGLKFLGVATSGNKNELILRLECEIERRGVNQGRVIDIATGDENLSAEIDVNTNVNNSVCTKEREGGNIEIGEPILATVQTPLNVGVEEREYGQRSVRPKVSEVGDTAGKSVVVGESFFSVEFERSDQRKISAAPECMYHTARQFGSSTGNTVTHRNEEVTLEDCGRNFQTDRQYRTGSVASLGGRSSSSRASSTASSIGRRREAAVKLAQLRVGQMQGEALRALQTKIEAESAEEETRRAEDRAREETRRAEERAREETRRAAEEKRRIEVERNRRAIQREMERIEENVEQKRLEAEIGVLEQFAEADGEPALSKGLLNKLIGRRGSHDKSSAVPMKYNLIEETYCQSSNRETDGLEHEGARNRTDRSVREKGSDREIDRRTETSGELSQTHAVVDTGSNRGVVKEESMIRRDDYHCKRGDFHREKEDRVFEDCKSNESVKHVTAIYERMRLPQKERRVFDGQRSQYLLFKTDFENDIGASCITTKEKLSYLYQFTSGVAKDIVHSCLYMNPKDGYREAWSLLDRRFSNIEAVGQEFVERLLARAPVGRDDSEGLDKLAIDMATTRNAVSSLPYGLAQLNNPDTIMKVLRKVPFPIQEKWRQVATRISHVEGRSADFNDALDLVMKEGEVASNPLYSRAKFAEKDGETKTRKVMMGSVNSSPGCLMCGESHKLGECGSFRKLSREGRVKLLREKRLCFMCFREGHMSRTCENPIKCLKCGKWHQTLLHTDQEYERVTRTDYMKGTSQGGMDQGNRERGVRRQYSSGDANRESHDDHRPRVMMSVGRGAMPVVPVTVTNMHGERFLTAALVDSGSAITLCSKKMSWALQSSLRELRCRLSMVTVDGEKEATDGVHEGLRVETGTDEIDLPPVYVVNEIPVDREDVVSDRDLEEWDHLRRLKLEECASVEMLIGTNVPAISEPLEVIHAPVKGQPYATRTRLGWMVHGVSVNCVRAKVGRIGVKNANLENLVKRAFDVGFEDVGACESGLSAFDRRWMSIVHEGCRKIDGKLTIPLPKHDNLPELPDSRFYALKRTEGVKKKLDKVPDQRLRYDEVMCEMINRGYVELVTETRRGGSWYLPHFPVTHPDKPDKVRIVFDCAAVVKGVCLNDLLITGPRIGCELFDVLCRFREGPYAYTADIEAMFHQVAVPEEDRDYLRFHWWGTGDQWREYRLTVHLFGACSSPSVAAFALQQAATASKNLSAEARSILKRNFYVDDCLVAGWILEEMKLVASEVRTACAEGGFNLCKYRSIRRLGLGEGVDKRDDCRLEGRSRCEVKALGVVWNARDDSLAAALPTRDVPTTRRSLLSWVAAVFDPLGVLAPLVLQGRKIIQGSLREKFEWDEPLGRLFGREIERWVREVGDSYVCIERNMLGEKVAKRYEMHFFSDASQGGHGAVAYLRWRDACGWRCSFLFGKARVNSMKAVSIPRLELVAAVLAARMRVVIQGILKLKVQRTVLWTDSMTVIRYLRNERDRFNVFVSNRVTLIKERTTVNEWRYVNSELNAADDASRGIQTRRWIEGPDFLCQDENKWPIEVIDNQAVELEVLKGNVMTITTESATDKLVNRYSDWRRLCRVVAVWLKFFMFLKDRSATTVTADDLKMSEKHIIKFVQSKHYGNEISCLSKQQAIRKSSPLRRLDAELDDGILRVGGRLRRADMSSELKHPAILPAIGIITELLIRESHDRLGHLSSATVLTDLRERVWIVKGLCTVKKVLRRCVVCRKTRGKRMLQKMADLPIERITPSEVPFRNTGVDCFGPFEVKKGRRREKRYGAIFTCMAMRAVHLEVVADMSTDSMFNAIRRFLARRGVVKKFMSDNGTNFVGVRKEMLQVLAGEDVRRKVVGRGINWQFNPPGASHFGGAWESLIRVVRRVLESTIGKNALHDDELNTVFCEVELCVNSRPLTTVTSDSGDLSPLTPNKLLTMGPCAVVDCESSELDLCSRKRWRAVQHLANLFWRRWCKEYRSTLQERRKWERVCRNVREGDVVLVVDETEQRCHWKLGMVDNTFPGLDGLVRSVILRSNGKEYRRPVTKLVLVLSDEEML